MYAIWKACDRFGLLPPGVKPSWDDNHVISKSQLIAYNQIRDAESIGCPLK